MMPSPEPSAVRETECPLMMPELERLAGGVCDGEGASGCAGPGSKDVDGVGAKVSVGVGDADVAVSSIGLEVVGRSAHWLMSPLLEVSLTVSALMSPLVLASRMEASAVRETVPVEVPSTAAPSVMPSPEPSAVSETECPLMMPELERLAWRSVDGEGSQ